MQFCSFKAGLPVSLARHFVAFSAEIHSDDILDVGFVFYHKNVDWFHIPRLKK
jgi:hypothetical protein